MKKVTEIFRTSIAYPEQYEGKLNTGEEFYVRCRFGSGRLDVNNKTVNEIEYEEDRWRGTFEEGDLVRLFFEAGIYLDKDLVKDSE